MIWLFTPQKEINKFSLSILCIFFLFCSCGTNNEIEIIERTHKDGSPALIAIYNQIGSQKHKTKETYFFESGAVKMAGFYNGERRDGLWKAYFENGNVQSECYYVRGVKHGPIKVWSNNGTILYQGQYLKDNKYGEWNFFDTNGKLIKSEIYKLPNQ